MTRRNWLIRGAALSLLGRAGVSPAQAPLDQARHGLVLLMRHAQTEPGNGDPAGFVLGECATQRNLSDAGRLQARRLGQRIRLRGWTPQRVRSSAWCRCLDTAQLAFGRAEPWPALNSFFDSAGAEPAQTAELRHALATATPGHIEAWVTHQVNVMALCGESLAMGELLVMQGGSAEGVVLLRMSV